MWKQIIIILIVIIIICTLLWYFRVYLPYKRYWARVKSEKAFDAQQKIYYSKLCPPNSTIIGEYPNFDCKSITGGSCDVKKCMFYNDPSRSVIDPDGKSRICPANSHLIGDKSACVTNDGKYSCALWGNTGTMRCGGASYYGDGNYYGKYYHLSPYTTSNVSLGPNQIKYICPRDSTLFGDGSACKDSKGNLCAMWGNPQWKKCKLDVDSYQGDDREYWYKN